jgi:hypothetical protein
MQKMRRPLPDGCLHGQEDLRQPGSSDGDRQNLPLLPNKQFIRNSTTGASGQLAFLTSRLLGPLLLRPVVQ